MVFAGFYGFITGFSTVPAKYFLPWKNPNPGLLRCFYTGCRKRFW